LTISAAEKVPQSAMSMLHVSVIAVRERGIGALLIDIVDVYDQSQGA
jgi:hypothetical protein